MTSIGAVAVRPLRAGRHSDRDVASLAFLAALWFALAFAVLCLVVLLVDAFVDGLPRLDANLFTRYTSQVMPERAGARAAILGSMWVIGTTAVLAIPLGVAAAVYLEEFADPARWYNHWIEVNLQNLAAVPAIVYGMLTAGLALAIGMPRRVVLAGGIALALLILPVIIITTREALRAVPAEIRQGSLALGATPLQTVWKQTLPTAIPGVATGTILALSRALGEAAPLLLLGGLVFVNYDPDGLMSGFTTMPIQIFSWTAQPQAAFREVASAAIIVLLGLLLAMNAVAIVIRNRYREAGETVDHSSPRRTSDRGSRTDRDDEHDEDTEPAEHLVEPLEQAPSRTGPAEPAPVIECENVDIYYWAFRAVTDVSMVTARTRSPPSSARPAAARRRCCAGSTG